MTDVRNGRSWICALVGVAFAALAISGLMMVSHLRIGLDIKVLHVVMGIIFIAAGAIHLALNWRTFIMHFKNRSAIIAATAAVLIAVALLFVGGSEGSGPHRYGNGNEGYGIGAGVGPNGSNALEDGAGD
jgi:hypothetical protein